MFFVGNEVNFSYFLFRGSNNSIPDLLKQNGAKKVNRPWSAQNETSQAKVVLKKPHPHSAKDALFRPPRPSSAKQSKKTSIAGA